MSTALLPARLMAGAIAPLPAIVRAAATTPTSAPTPCAAWDLGALARHLIFWSPFLAASGRRAEPIPVASTEPDVPLEGWPDAVVAGVNEVAAAWSDAAAWTGTTTMGGPDALPAEMIGGMVLGELVVHGWDLARAAGVRAEWSQDVLVATYEAVVGMAAQGRQMGIFGPEVAVPADAPLLDRIAAATGRDPGWRA